MSPRHCESNHDQCRHPQIYSWRVAYLEHWVLAHEAFLAQMVNWPVTAADVEETATRGNEQAAAAVEASHAQRKWWRCYQGLRSLRSSVDLEGIKASMRFVRVLRYEQPELQPCVCERLVRFTFGDADGRLLVDPGELAKLCKMRRPAQIFQGQGAIALASTESGALRGAAVRQHRRRCCRRRRHYCRRHEATQSLEVERRRWRDAAA